MKPTVIDLFAGVGGLSLGFEMRGFNVLVANEYDKSIAAAYTANHKSTKMIVGDITSLDLDKTFGQYKGKSVSFLTLLCVFLPQMGQISYPEVDISISIKLTITLKSA